MLWSKCCVPPVPTFRAFLKGGFLLLYFTKLSLYLFLQHTFLRAGRVLLFAEVLALSGILDTWFSFTR